MMEEKVYSIIGKVEIGTDEYRDLIEAVKDAEKEKDDYSRRYWDERSKVSDLEKQIKSLQSRVELQQRFISSNSEIVTKWQFWQVNNLTGDSNE